MIVTNKVLHVFKCTTCSCIDGVEQTNADMGYCVEHWGHCKAPYILALKGQCKPHGLELFWENLVKTSTPLHQMGFLECQNRAP